MINKLKWQLKRLLLMRNETSFYAHWDTLATLDSIFAEGVHLYRGARVRRSTIGKYTYMLNAKVGNADLGSFCSIGPEALVGGLGRHPTSYISTHPAFYSTKKQAGISLVSADLFNELPRTKIGSDVWIGARAIVLDGVKIHDGAIIAAGSVVTKDVPPYAIVGGIPAKLIKYRFKEEIINKLLDVRWWDMDFETIKVNSGAFCNPEITLEDIENIECLKGNAQ